MSDIKTINISGDAAREMSGGANKKGRRSTKKNQSGGSEEALRGVSPQMNNVKPMTSPSNLANSSASPNSTTWLKYPADAPVPPQVRPVSSHVPATPNQSAGPTQLGGSTNTKQIRVELKKKPTSKKVHLNPKKTDAPKTSQIQKKNQTRKIRKVTLGIKSLHKKLTRAKKVHKEINNMPLDKLKEKLIKGGLIKENSKAPESVLRQIAKDAEVVAKKAL